MPPIMALDPPKGSEYLVGSIQKYLIERFPESIHYCPLEENYRSAEDIVDYAKTIGYSQNLRASNPKTALHLLSAIQSPPSGSTAASLPWSPLWNHIIDANKKVLTLIHDDDLSSQGNEFEAKIVAVLVYLLRQTVSSELDGRGQANHVSPTSEEFWKKCVGIVTPHRAQRAMVIRELQTLFPGDQPNLIDSAVDTVEKFQGGERHTIIITFAVGDTDVILGEEAFLMQLERTNVAISRAIAKSIVIMPATLAGHVPHDKKVIETAHAIKGYVDEFCDKEIIGDISFNNNLRKAKLRYHS